MFKNYCMNNLTNVEKKRRCNARLMLYLPLELKSEIQKLANQKGLKMSEFVRMLIMGQLRKFEKS